MNNIKDLGVLEFLAGDLESMDEFNETYECLLNECKATGNLEMVRAMQKLLLHQAAFLMTEWMREKAIVGKHEEREIIQ